MPENSRHLPAFIPSFSVDQQSGGLESNPAGSVAVAKMERLLRDRDHARASFVSEKELQSRRQATVDKYYRGERKGDTVRMGLYGTYLELPMVASPQPVHTFKSSVLHENTLNARALQAKDFKKTFMALESDFIHKEVDRALYACDERKKEVRDKKQSKMFKGLSKLGREKLDHGFSVKDKEYIFAPLEESISFLNRHFLDQKSPVQVRWREVWREEGKSSKELFMIFPNYEYQANSSFRKWNGMNEVVE